MELLEGFPGRVGSEGESIEALFGEVRTNRREELPGFEPKLIWRAVAGAIRQEENTGGVGVFQAEGKIGSDVWVVRQRVGLVGGGRSHRVARHEDREKGWGRRRVVELVERL